MVRTRATTTPTLAPAVQGASEPATGAVARGRVVARVEVVMVEAVIREDVVVEVMVVTKMVEVMGKLEPLHHNMVGATDRRTVGPIVRFPWAV